MTTPCLLASSIGPVCVSPVLMVFWIFVNAGVVELDKHDIHADLDDTPPWNDDFTSAAKQSEELASARHDNGFDSSLPQIELQVGYLPQFLSVHDVDDILRLKIGYFHAASPHGSSYVLLLIYVFAQQYVTNAHNKTCEKINTLRNKRH